MFSVLIESETGPARRGRWLAGSTIVHSTLVAAAIAATVHPLAAGSEPLPPPRQLIYTRPAPSPVRASVNAASVSRSVAAPPTAPVPRFDVAIPQIANADPSLPTSLDPLALVRHAFRAPGDASGDRGDPSGGGGVLRSAQVDRTVVAHASNGVPRYPSTLRTAGVEGEVLVRFVVDTLGRVERGSITVVRTSHDAFAEVVTAWLLRNRYAPAEVGGRAVRQLVEQRVDFSLEKN